MMQCELSLTIGSYVRIINQGTIGQVIRLDKGKVLVSIDPFLFYLPIQAVERAQKPSNPPVRKNTTNPINFVMPESSNNNDVTLDLHGLNKEQTLFALDKFLDNALLLGHSPLKIIHGQGKGILRNTVRNYLQQHHLVKTVITKSPIRRMASITVAEL